MSSVVVSKDKYRKIFVLGDIHGARLALDQVLERSGFDNENDLLIFVGDVCDGFPDTQSSIEKLMEIKNLAHVAGNHDMWMIQYCDGELTPQKNPSMYQCWFQQGGRSTFESYPEGFPEDHINFLRRAYHYVEIAEKEGIAPNKVVTHGGFSWGIPIHEQNTSRFCWDRDMINTAFFRRKQEKIISPYYTEIYVGHTPTISFNEEYTEPQYWSGVWNVDTGASYTGKLSIIDIDTKEIFQSDIVRQLYPDHRGRNRESYNDSIKRE